MNRKEIKMAMHLVKGYTERIELIALDSGGQRLTAVWADGSGSRAFCALDDVESWCRAEKRAKEWAQMVAGASSERADALWMLHNTDSKKT